MSDLKIENGQFWRGNQIVKPEFGDRDQIFTLRKAVEKAEAEEKGIKLPVVFRKEEVTVYDMSVSFKCVCGQICSRLDEEVPEDDAEGEYFDELNVRCRKCKSEYELKWDKKTRTMSAVICPEEETN